MSPGLILKYLADLPRSVKAAFLICIDAVILGFSMLLAFAVRFDPASLENQFWILSKGVWVLIAVQMLALLISGLYRSVLRHAGSELLVLLLRSVLLGAGLFALLDLMLEEYQLPRSIIVMSAAFAFLGLLSTRLMIRWVVRIHVVEPQHPEKLKRVAIYGAGSAGLQLYESLRQEGTYQITAFVDDNPKLQGGVVRGISIISFSALQALHAKNPLDWVLLALPGVKHGERKNILNNIRLLKVGVRVLPTADQLMRGTANASQLQEVEIADLLGRDEIAQDEELLHQDIKGRNILVTGAGGSIGSELCRVILRDSPKILVLLELNELALYQAELTFSRLSSIPIVPCLGSVHNSALVKHLLMEHEIQTVYHSAAYKHVPLVEENPLEGLRNNALGTKALVEKCIEAEVDAFVLISTDKAVRPTNVMGASKRIAEMIVQDTARRFPERKLGIVRFGNVLDSSGSVVPLFREQIKNRQAITVTHPDITRYFMSIGEAARLVIQAGAMSNNGEVFLLDMGQPVRIRDLALQMIELSGLVPEKDIPLQFTGLRPGEKLYEELLIDPAQSQPTRHPRIYSSEEPLPESEVLQKEIQLLSEAISKRDLNSALESMKRLVPEYNPENGQ
ncbi:MAG TPA: polysaccharide biosynthesis protein [Candidatus Lambdaproteobacteria bacterium]|nr:polysaccharide biosynthesis protein [Candidatus Lambdaproteobacteria bacterium]